MARRVRSGPRSTRSSLPGAAEAPGARDGIVITGASPNSRLEYTGFGYGGGGTIYEGSVTVAFQDALYVANSAVVSSAGYGICADPYATLTQGPGNVFRNNALGDVNAACDRGRAFSAAPYPPTPRCVRHLREMQSSRTARALLMVGALSAALASASQAQEPTLADALAQQGVRAHMAALQRVADANGGNRAAGTSGYAASARYVERTLREAGYRVWRQPFTITYSETLREAARVPSLGPLAPLIMEGSPSTPAGGLTAPLALPADPLGCSADDFADAQGSVVLLERGTCTFAQKSQNAAAAGAVAALIYNTPDEPEDVPFSGSLGDAAPESTVPTAGLTRRTGERLRERLERGDAGVQVTLELRVRRGVRRTANVLAEPASAAPGQSVVMVGAHLDSVPAGPGINDNGSGVGLTLELARQLAELGQAGGVRLAFWGAEELGLLGASHYVENLTPAELEGIRAYLNFDMVASPNAAPFAYGDPDIIGTFGEAFAERGLELLPDVIGGRSDHAPFEEAGVRVAGLFSGAEGVKSAAEVRTYGGSAAPYDACYHRACDTFAGSRTPISTRYLDLFADAAADALQRLLAER